MKTFRELSVPFFKDVYHHFDDVCSEHKVNFYLIGAQARDVHLLESCIKPVRATMDIDFAIMLPDIETFDKIKDCLVERGFKKDDLPYRMIYSESDTIIDLLPFGQIEQERTVKFNHRDVELSVNRI